MRLPTILSFYLVLSTASLHANESELYFVCHFESPNIQNHTYSFVFREEENYLYGIESNKVFDLSLNTSYQIKAFERKQISAGQFEETSFYLNRITGTGEISHLELQKRSEAEIQECLTRRGWDCKGYRILDMRTENGRCERVKRAL